MKRLLNRLVVTETEQDNTDTTDESDASTPVEWADLSTRTAGPIGTEERLDQPPTATRQSAGPDSDRLLAAVLDTIDKPTLLVDRAGAITHLNCSAHEAFETTDTEVVGTESHQLHGGQQLTEQVLDAGEAVVDHRETVTIAGEQQPISRTVTPITDEGEVVAAIETINIEAAD